MDAIILAAGLGTRLRPLTENRPKALVEVDGETLLEINIRRLKNHGIRRIVVNVHHFADMIAEYISQRDWGVEVIISDERKMLLDTGGALKQAIPLCDSAEPIVVHNVDILSTIDLESMLKKHITEKNEVTLAVCKRNTMRQLLIDNHGMLQGWRDSKNNQTIWVDEEKCETKELAFSGIAIVQPSFATLLPNADRPYPIIPQYLANARNCRIGTFEHEQDEWLDVGKPETLAKAKEFIAKHTKES